MEANQVREVVYQELSPAEGVVKVVRVEVPWFGFARASEVGIPLTSECFPREAFAVN